MPYAQDAGKPMFDLKPADGVLGGHVEAVKQCEKHFRQLAIKIAKAIAVEVPVEVEE